MDANFESSSSQTLLLHEDEGKGFVQIAAEISNFSDKKLNFFGSSTKQECEDSKEVEKDGDHNETEVTCDNDDEEEFSFVINSSGSLPISGNRASTDAQIQPSYSLSNRDLLSPHKDCSISKNQLPSESQVKQALTKMPPTTTLHKGKTKPSYGTSSGLYYVGEKTSPELSKKSNSTGFSMLWRSKDYLYRSHSDNSDNLIVKLYRSQKENRRRWRMKMYSHQWRNEMQNNKLFLTLARK